MPSTLRALSVAAASLLASVVLAGCGLTSSTSVVAPTPVAGSHFSGKVFGGQSPIPNVRIRIYAVGNTGYGSAYAYTTGSDLLGSNVVTTDANGSFSVTGDYTCPTAATNVYVVASGGNPVPASGANNNSVLMSAYGPCGNAATNASNYIYINELSTVAAVYALAPFMTGPANVGSTATNLVGINNAFSSAAKIIGFGTGVVPGPALPAGATLPIAEINTLGNILATCVNSTGVSTLTSSSTTSDGTHCGDLFVLARANGVTPLDTATALLNIARNPSQNVVALNNLPQGPVPFNPTLGNTPPSAWTLAITYAPAGLSGPTGIAPDQSGNIWIANKTSNSVTLLAPSGAPIGTFAAGLAGSGAIAVDQSGNAYVPGNATNNIYQIPAGGGTATTFYAGTGSSIGITNALAVDGSGQIWATGSQNGVTVLSSTGTLVGTYTGAGATNAQSIAITSH